MFMDYVRYFLGGWWGEGRQGYFQMSAISDILFRFLDPSTFGLLGLVTWDIAIF